ncbi:dihydropteroate synthase [Kiloniella laminariae]|uniref:dihydropteroate synthase n=1 Tax=Kiloniella laminariae TaxID=454162 RepID=A0ABT4LI74_9PROT|nr:dihydropteroate synthase [Kiloniella laminariae]MCZ4280804.1 dihydropteroate synthase [Kiloniella laminariae]
MTGDLYIRPLHISSEKDSLPGAAPLLGSGAYYSAAEVTLRSSDGSIARREIVASGEILSWVRNKSPLHAHKAVEILKKLSAKRPDFAGLDMTQPQIMAVINVTPDSFSDGGDRYDPARAVDDALRMRELGASILDVGGESTRPGAEPVSEDEELRRVLPVIEKLAEAGALVSIDTRHARVMREAVAAGAGIINDVTALEGDKDSLETAALAGVPVILMHMQGTPQTMQDNPCYQDVALDVFDYLEKRVAACVAAGIPREAIAVDPGIGFGKTTEHNLRLLDAQAQLHGTGCPLLLGVSRKGFIGKLSRNEEPKARVAGSLSCALAGLERGVQMFRVHDVAETAQAFAIARAIS